MYTFRLGIFDSQPTSQDGRCIVKQTDTKFKYLSVGEREREREGVEAKSMTAFLSVLPLGLAGHAWPRLTSDLRLKNVGPFCLELPSTPADC